MHRSHASNFGRHLGHWSEVLLVQLSLNSKSSKGVSKILWRWWAQVIRPVAEQYLSVRFEKVNQDTTTTIWRFMITKCQYIITHAILPSLLYKWKKSASRSTYKLHILRPLDSRASNHLYNAIKKMHPHTWTSYDWSKFVFFQDLTNHEAIWNFIIERRDYSAWSSFYESGEKASGRQIRSQNFNSK